MARQTCADCGKPLDDYNKVRGTCHSCRSSKGLIAELEIAIKATGDDPKRIRDWPAIRQLLVDRFGARHSTGEPLSDDELWDLCVGWLKAAGLGENEYLPIPLSNFRLWLRDGIPNLGRDPHLESLLESAGRVFELAGNLAKVFGKQAETDDEFVTLSNWPKHARLFENFDFAIKRLADAIRTPPAGFEAVAAQLREAGNAAKDIKGVANRPTNLSYRDFTPRLNTICLAGSEAVRAAQVHTEEDEYDFLDPPSTEPESTSESIDHSDASGQYAKALTNAESALRSAKEEIDLARRQSEKAATLNRRLLRSSVQAAGAIVASIDAGFASICPLCDWTIDSIRKPDDPNRTPLKFKIGNTPEWTVRSVKMGSGCDANGKLYDDTLRELWIQSICPYLRSKSDAPKGNAGSFDFPKHKTNSDGKIVDRDGNALVRVDEYDEKTGRLIASRSVGIPATEEDGYDEHDALEHLRMMAADWSDACSVGIDLLQSEIAAKVEPNQVPFETYPLLSAQAMEQMANFVPSTEEIKQAIKDAAKNWDPSKLQAATADGDKPKRKATKKRGRPRRTTERKDQDKKLCEAWKTGRYRGYAELAAEFRIKEVDVKRALDAERKSPSE